MVKNKIMHNIIKYILLMCVTFVYVMLWLILFTFVANFFNSDLLFNILTIIFTILHMILSLIGKFKIFIDDNYKYNIIIWPND